MNNSDYLFFRCYPIFHSVNLQLIFPRQHRKGLMWFCLIPENCSGNIILQRKITAIASPTEVLYGHFNVFLKTNGVSYVPAVHSKALGNVVMSIAPDHLAKS